ncbi:MAG TPA: LptF/LptG family permease [Hyphomicrobiaceae bacterium]|nr:LptF/LptG family permease [Hyphomicrobiaceae bacterium]
MGILGRYVLRQVVGSIGLILASLTGVTWIAVALRQLDLMTSQGQGVTEFLKLTTLAIPSLIAFITPLAVIIASLHVLNRLNSDSEQIVMTAGGASSLRMLRPFALVGIVMGAVVLCINHLLAPVASLELKNRAQDIRTELVGQVIQAGRFTEPEPNVTMHIRERAPDGALLGLLIRDSRDGSQISTYFAERGYLRTQEGATYLLMEAGRILRQKNQQDPGEMVVFDRYAVDLNRLEQRTEAVTSLRPREMSTAELFKSHASGMKGQSGAGRFLAEAHDRTATALYPLAFILIALAFAGQAQTTRQNRTNALVVGFVVAVGVRLGGIAAANATIVRPHMLWLMYAVPIVAGGLAFAAMVINLYPRRPPLFVRYVTEFAGTLRRSLDGLRRGRAKKTAGASPGARG